jgi:hypothetical protein
MTQEKDYTTAKPPLLKATTFIKDPVDVLKVIGYVCRDLRKGTDAALIEADGFEGDLDDEVWLDADVLLDLQERGIGTVYLREDEHSRVLEFDQQDFMGGINPTREDANNVFGPGEVSIE